jgi:hypothetical protein
MGGIRTYENSSLEKEMTNVVNVYCEFLYNEGYLTAEQYKDLILNTGIIIKQPSFFCNLWERLGFKDEKRDKIFVVRQFTIKEKEEE